jgi:TonB family protein
MKFLSAVCLSSLSLAACATGTDRATTPRAMVAEDTEQVFPAARNPHLPSADRRSSAIRSQAGEVASADIRLCVTPDGRVQAVDLVRGSSSAAFDQALLHDAAEWQFSDMPGSAHMTSNVRVCGVTTISYRPRR